MTSGPFESGKWSSVDRVKLSLQLAHRHFLSHRSNFFRKKKRKRPNKNSMERDEKQKVESISREKMAAGPTQATSVSWPAAKAARLAYFGLVQLKSNRTSNQGSTFRPGREKGNLSCIIYMGERDGETLREKSFLPSASSSSSAAAATHTRHLAAAASPADRSRFITVKWRQGPRLAASFHMGKSGEVLFILLHALP